MTIEFKDGRYFSQIWFLEGGDKDWLAFLYKDPGEKWIFHYRFRYYSEDPKQDPFHDNDRKTWFMFAITAEKPEEEVLKNCDTVAEAMLAAGFGPKLHKLLVRTDVTEAVMAAMESQPWCHVKALTPEEAALEDARLNQPSDEATTESSDQ